MTKIIFSLIAVALLGLAACASTDHTGADANFDAPVETASDDANDDLTAADGGQTTTIEDTDKRKEGWGSGRASIKMNGLSATSLGLQK